MRIKNKISIKFSVFAGIFILCAVAFGVSEAEAANFYFSPASGVFNKNENFTAGVFVNSETAINAVQGLVNFPVEYLEVLSVKSNNNSIVDLWVQKPSFSNAGSDGNVHFEGVILNPGFSGVSGKIIDIVFRVKKEGSAGLNFSSFSILANDGRGTNVSVPGGNASFVLLPAVVVPVVEEKPVQQVQREDIDLIENKIKSVEEKIDSIGQATNVVETETGILGIWEILPKWVKVSVLALIGVASIILALVILSFGLVVLIWFWSYVWRRREKINNWLGRVPKRIRNHSLRLLGFAEMAEKEMESDVRYAVREIKKDIEDAETEESLEKTIRHYVLSLKKIIRRFTTKNTKGI